MQNDFTTLAGICVVALTSAVACGGDGTPGGTNGTAGGGNAGAAGAPSAGSGNSGGTAGGVGLGAWETLGSDIGGGQDPVMLLMGSTPFVGYDLNVTSVLLTRWNGTAWSDPVPDPTNHNVITEEYSGKHFCTDSNGVFMAYTDRGDGGLPMDNPRFFDRILVYRWTEAGGWMAQNGGNEVSLGPAEGSDQDPGEPAVACRNGFDPAVAWTESEVTPNNQDWDLDAWVARVGSGPATRSAVIHRVLPQATDLRTVGVALSPAGTAYVAFEETAVDATAPMNVYVSRADGTPVGGVIDTTIDGTTSAPSLVVVSDTEMYLAWAATHDSSYSHQVYAARWDGSDWSLIGGGPVTAFPSDHFESGDPDLMLIDGDPVVAWHETGTSEPAGSEYVFVARWNGSSWNLIGDRINIDTARQAQDPTLAYDPAARMLYVAFEEYVDGGAHVFARRLALP